MMKKIKKCIALLLAAVMVFSMSAGAFASTSTNDTGGGSITIENAQDGVTYYAYKIFDVTYNTDENAYSYTITEDSAWYEIVSEYAEDEDNGLTLTLSADGSCYVVTVYEGTFSAADFAEYLLSALGDDEVSVNADGSGTDENGDGTVEINDLSLGYYLIVGTSTSDNEITYETLAELTTTDPSVTIYDKNAGVPFEKTDNTESADVGDTVNYTITSEVPSTTGYTSYTYEISDTMSDGLTFDKDVEIKIGNITLSISSEKNDDGSYNIMLDDEVVGALMYVEAIAETEDTTGTGGGFVLNLYMLNLQKYVGEIITITYSATVNSNAIATIENNEATLKYSNDPNSDTTTEKEDEETVYTSKIVINKTDGSKNSALAGAKFVLYKTIIDEDGNEITLYYLYENGEVSWVDDVENATIMITDDDGTASFGGLADGTYYLLEVEAPDGYNLLTDPIGVFVSGSDTNTEELTVTSSVENYQGTELPETGGMGRTILYAIGIILILGAGIVLVVRKRAKAD